MIAATDLVEENGRPTMPGTVPIFSSSVEKDLTRLRESPESFHTPKHVVVVMDGLKEFSMKPLEWVFKNVAACCTITLLGVMPWLNTPLSSKTWSDIWTMDREDLLTIEEKTEWKSDVKYQKVQRLIGLCRNFGVVPQIRIAMGYPLRLLVVEQISSFHPTLVVFDRHHDRKNIQFYAEKVVCNIVKLNNNGEVDMIKGLSHFGIGENTPGGESTPSMLPPPKWKNILKLRASKKLSRERKVYLPERNSCSGF